MVGIAQSVEHRVVAPAVAGSSPVTHPRNFKGLADNGWPYYFYSPHYSPQRKENRCKKGQDVPLFLGVD